MTLRRSKCRKLWRRCGNRDELQRPRPYLNARELRRVPLGLMAGPVACTLPLILNDLLGQK